MYIGKNTKKEKAQSRTVEQLRALRDRLLAELEQAAEVEGAMEWGYVMICVYVMYIMYIMYTIIISIIENKKLYIYIYIYIHTRAGCQEGAVDRRGLDGPREGGVGWPQGVIERLMGI